MGFLDEAFNIDDMPVSEKRDFEPIPEGWYTAAITSADVKDTKAQTGKYIAVRFDITGPEHQGRVVFTNLNTRNPNPKAEEIGRQQLGDIMRAGGLSRLEDTDQLIGINLTIKVTIRNDPNYGKSNEIKAYRSVEGSAPPATAAAAPSNGKAAPPWATK
jgi:hypothetical protein|tara:strand:+ start:203 stop:679 length:477 start_codon:yes stop_codon:yes gene_type:complete